jgi:4'-phosphopantetheinyl transferase
MAMRVLSHNSAVPVVLSPDAVHIWCRETGRLDQTAVDQAEASLSVEERARCARFRFPRDRRDYAIAHDLLRRSLDGFERNTVPPSFSLSHARGIVACAIAADMPIGVDAERIDRSMAVDELAERHFTRSEMAALQRSPDSARSTLFVELWTLKEAFVKAIGLGLTLAPNMMSFELDERGSVRFTPPPGIDGQSWHFALFAPSESTRVAVAVCCGVRNGPRFILHS